MKHSHKKTKDEVNTPKGDEWGLMAWIGHQNPVMDPVCSNCTRKKGML